MPAQQLDLFAGAGNHSDQTGPRAVRHSVANSAAPSIHQAATDSPESRIRTVSPSREGLGPLSRKRNFRNGRTRAVSKCVVCLTGDRGFESISLHQPVCLSRDFIFLGQEPRLSARVCRAALAARSAESRRARRHRANLRQYLCGAIFQYRIFGDAVATSCCGLKSQGGSPDEVGLRTRNPGARLLGS
jgi:hypothetical protein